MNISEKIHTGDIGEDIGFYGNPSENSGHAHREGVLKVSGKPLGNLGQGRSISVSGNPLWK